MDMILLRNYPDRSIDSDICLMLVQLKILCLLAEGKNLLKAKVSSGLDDWKFEEI
jgi:hypothetical protein